MNCDARLDEIQSAQITFLVVVRPRNKSVLAHHDRRRFRVALHDFLHREAEFEAGAHPLHIFHFIAENFFREALTFG